MGFNLLHHLVILVGIVLVHSPVVVFRIMSSHCAMVTIISSLLMSLDVVGGSTIVRGLVMTLIFSLATQLISRILANMNDAVYEAVLYYVVIRNAIRR